MFRHITDCFSHRAFVSSIPDLLVAMAGAIIENMSTKKLVILGVTLLLFQAFAFMVGGLIGKFFWFFFVTFCLLLLSCVSLEFAPVRNENVKS